MKKSDIRTISQALDSLPINKCGDKGLMVELVHDRVKFKRLNAEITTDTDSLRSEIIGELQPKVDEYVRAANAGEEEKAKELLPEVKDVILDFDRAFGALMSQDVDVKIPYKVDEASLISFVVDAAPEMIDDIDKLIPIMK